MKSDIGTVLSVRLFIESSNRAIKSCIKLYKVFESGYKVFESGYKVFMSFASQSYKVFESTIKSS